MNYEQWEEKYKPINNPFTENNLFETFGEECDFVERVNPLNVWTLVDGEDGTYIVEGLHSVNRVGYFITGISHNNEKIEVLYMSDPK